jgi:hypothetical protein
MPETSGPVPEREALIAGLRREFAEGLPERLKVLRSALDDLTRCYDRDRAETFYYRVHGLKGTAASHAAKEIVGPATRLADRGYQWMERRAAPPDEVSAAATDLEELGAAMRAYRQRLQGDLVP